MNRVSQPKQTYWAAGRHNSLKGEPGLFTFHLFLWFRRQRRFIPSYHFTYYVLISSISVYNGFQMQKVIWGDRLGGKRSLLRIQLLLLLIVSWERIGVLVWSVNQFENVRGCAGEVRIFECVCVCVCTSHSLHSLSGIPSPMWGLLYQWLLQPPGWLIWLRSISNKSMTPPSLQNFVTDELSGAQVSVFVCVGPSACGWLMGGQGGRGFRQAC